MNDISNYEKLQEDAQKLYHGVSRAHSPAFNQEVHCTAEGFNHRNYAFLERCTGLGHK